MYFINQRYSDNGNSTQGLLLERVGDWLKFFSHCLEDERRAVKVIHETRFPAGLYPLKIRKEDTPLTIKHRADYGLWFKYHIEITGIPNFSDVYVHSGISEKHTSGCLLLNDTANNNMIEVGDMARSKQAVQRFYNQVYPYLDEGGEAFLEVRDEEYLMNWLHEKKI